MDVTVDPASAPQTEPEVASGAVVLEVEHLSVEFRTAHGPVRVVEDVSFTLRAGETLGLVGESGSGKSVTSLALLGMIGPPNGSMPEGSVRLMGRELTGMPERQLRRIRGREMSMIFQEPKRSLDPAFTVGDQIAETLRAHLGLSRRDAWQQAVRMLDTVGIPSASRRAHDYPHQFSGGMAQRAMLAIALCCEPKVLIADEPTTALDVTVQAKVLDLIRDLQHDMGLALLFISHDLGVVAEMCDQVAVMYAGEVVEHASANEVFFHPKHPYTSALLEAIPRPNVEGGRLAAIPGVVPPAHAWPSGCRFHPRCEHAVDRCGEEVPVAIGSGISVRCLRAGELHLRGVE